MGIDLWKKKYSVDVKIILFAVGELESQLADLRDKVELLESEKAAVDQSLVLSCEERDELQKVVNDLQGDLDRTQEALQRVSFQVVVIMKIWKIGLLENYYNYPKHETRWFYYTVMHPKDADGMAQTVCTLIRLLLMSSVICVKPDLKT